MDKRYRVTAEYVTVTTSDPLSGRRVLLGYYRNALLPADMSDEAIEHHLSTRQIEEVEVDVVPVETPEGEDDGEQEVHTAEDLRQTDPAEANIVDGLGAPNAMTTVQDAVTPSDAVQASTAPERVEEPRRSAEKAEWVEYAVSQGADRADIEEKNPTKADLIATWGTPRS